MVDIVTPNVGFVEPVPESLMSDVDTYINNNWTKVEGMSHAPIVSSVPVAMTGYKAGDRIYVQSGGSHPYGIYLCMGGDSTWGSIWRPLTTVYGPWVRPGPVGTPNSVIADPTNFFINDSDSPLQYRMTRYGRVQWRGCVQAVTYWKDVSEAGGGYNLQVLKTFPRALWPGWRDPVSGVEYPSLPQLNSAAYPIGSAATVAQYSRVFWDATNKTFNWQVVRGSSTSIKKVFLSGSDYNIGTMGLS